MVHAVFAFAVCVDAAVKQPQERWKRIVVLEVQQNAQQRRTRC